MNNKEAQKISDAHTIGVQGRTSTSAAAAAKAAPGGAILEPGQIIAGRFQIMEILGLGGMGAVYKAYDRDIERVIALKCIRPELASNPEVVQRFTQELLLARQISQKNVIRIFDVRDSGGIKFITMEFVQGRDLGSLTEQKGKLPVGEAIGIMRQVCAGLAAAHAEGVIHRDLKPSNIMIEENGRVVVMDFGLARDQEESLMTRTGAIMGTFQYMSPEQAKGEKVDARSDIFTVGIILYELLTGKSPYPSDSSIASLLKRTQEAAPPPSSIEATIPRPVNAIVCKCLERDPKKRYESVNELIADLDDVLQVSSASRLPSNVSRHARKQWYLGLSALVLLAFALIFVIVRSTIPRPAEPAHAPVKILLADFQNETSDPVFDGTLESSFTLAMEGARFISAYNRAQAHKIIAKIKPNATSLDENNATLVAVREGVNVVISGLVKQEGGRYVIKCAAVDPATQKALGSAEATTRSKSDVLQAVADLAGKMRKLLGDTTPQSVQKQQQETVTASSIEAVHEYAVAQDLQFAGKWEEAQTHYSKAIELDANMGRAYAGMAVMNANTGRRTEADKYYREAMAHIDRMTDREKYRTRGGYYLFTRQPDKAIQEYDALMEQYPSDAVGASNLAFASFLNRDMAKAMDEGRHAVELSPKASLQRNNLALYSIYAGDYAAGAKAAEEVLQQNPGSADAMGALALAQTGQGDLAAATATYKKLEALSARGASMANMGLADLALYHGLAAEAVPMLDRGIAADIAGKDQSSAAIKSVALGQAYLSAGEKRKAVAAADEALKLSTDPSIMMAAGELYIAAGELPRASKLIGQLAAHIEPDPQIYSLFLQGNLALKNGQIKDAIDAFQKAQRISNTWLGHLYLGRAYLQNASFTEADSEFEVCLKRRGEASAVFLDDVPTFRLMPPLYYYLGRAQEGLRSPAASDSYRTFLKMQSGGTGELVNDARKRLGSQ